MFFLAALYKILSAVLEPVSDKRLSGGMNGIANGGMLYLKIMNTCLILFFLTIALTSAATGLGVGK
jgi:stage III sporulation protein AE